MAFCVSSLPNGVINGSFSSGSPCSPLCFASVPAPPGQLPASLWSGNLLLHIERPMPPLEAWVAEEHLGCLKLYSQAVAPGPCQSEAAMAVAQRVPRHFLRGVSSNVAEFHAVVASWQDSSRCKTLGSSSPIAPYHLSFYCSLCLSPLTLNLKGPDCSWSNPG